jgi:hypothetical protein
MKVFRLAFKEFAEVMGLVILILALIVCATGLGHLIGGEVGMIVGGVIVILAIAFGKCYIQARKITKETK